jgi:hypothetical protein
VVCVPARAPTRAGDTSRRDTSTSLRAGSSRRGSADAPSRNSRRWRLLASPPPSTFAHASLAVQCKRNASRAPAGDRSGSDLISPRVSSRSTRALEICRGVCSMSTPTRASEDTVTATHPPLWLKLNDGADRPREHRPARRQANDPHTGRVATQLTGEDHAQGRAREQQSPSSIRVDHALATSQLLGTQDRARLPLAQRKRLEPQDPDTHALAEQCLLERRASPSVQEILRRSPRRG